MQLNTFYQIYTIFIIQHRPVFVNTNEFKNDKRIMILYRRLLYLKMILIFKAAIISLKIQTVYNHPKKPPSVALAPHLLTDFLLYCTEFSLQASASQEISIQSDENI